MLIVMMALAVLMMAACGSKEETADPGIADIQKMYIAHTADAMNQ